MKNLQMNLEDNLILLLYNVSYYT